MAGGVCMIKFKIGLQLYSIRQMAEKDLFETLKRVKALGYDGVELAGLYGQEAKQVKEWMDGVGLECISAHVPWRELVEKTDETLDMYQSLGCSYVAVPSIEEELRTSRGMKKLAEYLIPVADACKKRGMELLYHNHDFEYEKGEDQISLLDGFLEQNPENLGAELDLGWVLAAGESPQEEIKKYHGRVPLLHMKDVEKKDPVYFCPVGKGLLPVRALMREAYQAGTRWLIVEQDNEDLTTWNDVEYSVVFLKGQGFE